MNGVKIMRPSLDDLGDQTILRGIISLDSLPNLRTDNYQRERLSNRANRRIQLAVDSQTALPDITLGMRGDRFAIDDDGSVILGDHVYIIDGQQRVETIKGHLAKFPAAPIKLGAIVYFNTNDRTERIRFQALNMYANRVAAAVILRNLRQDSPMLASLYGLTITDKGFAMYQRVCWRQNMARDELIGAKLYIEQATHLHAHTGPVSRTNLNEMGAGLVYLAKEVGLSQVRENVATYWELFDSAWGVRELQAKIGIPYLKGGFLSVISRIMSENVNFWVGKKLVIPGEIQKRLSSFNPRDPTVAALASGHGQAIETLRLLLIEHLNKRATTHRLVPRNPLPAYGSRDAA